MILTQKILRDISKIALFAIVFASVAPSISHALVAQQGGSSLVQAVCTSNGETITIQVLTSKGQQISTRLSADEKNSQSPASIVLHLNHCPFCSNPNTSVGIVATSLPIITLLTTQTQHLAVTTQPDLPRFSALPPPAQAPPAL